MLCIGLNVWLAQLQRNIKAIILMNTLCVQPVLCAEPFYCYHGDSLTLICSTVSRTNTTAAVSPVPKSLVKRRMLPDAEAANPSLSHLAQIPEPNYSSVGMAQAKQSDGAALGSHLHHCKFSLVVKNAPCCKHRKQVCAGESL